MQFIDLQAQYRSIEDKIKARINGVLEHGKYIMGPEVSELEERLADYVGVKHCISCANGTDALQLALMAKGIGPGDAVFTTAFTFFATAEVIALAGATPVFVDIDPNTYNISAEKLDAEVIKIKAEGKYTPKAIIAVDLFGQPANYTEIEQLAKKHNLYLVEDGAQGFGGEIHGRRACSFGDVATTSFFPAKPLGCYGDGGALFTNDDELAEVLRSLRVHGKGIDKYDNVRVGLNSRLDTLQAAILLEKFAIFPQEVELRNQVAQKYTSQLSSDFITPSVPNGFLSSWAQYTLRPKSGLAREEYQEKLKSAGIPTAIYYGKSLHLQSALSDKCVTADLSYSEEFEGNVFSLPMHPYLSDKDIERTVKVLTE